MYIDISIFWLFDTLFSNFLSPFLFLISKISYFSGYPQLVFDFHFFSEARVYMGVCDE